MLSPSGQVEGEIRILASIFHFALWPIRGEDPEKLLEVFKARYPGADHYPYAYINKGSERCSDDGEPHLSAGLPFLELLRVRELDDVLLVAARYFGGTKLGLGRLKKVFRDGAKEVIAKASYLTIAERPFVQVEVPFEKAMSFEGYLRKSGIEFEKEAREEGFSFLFPLADTGILSYLEENRLAYEKLEPRRTYL